MRAACCWTWVTMDTEEQVAERLAAECACYRNVECGVWCPPGWEMPVRCLGQMLDNVGSVVVAQVKEKFGGLRVYLEASDAHRREYEACAVLVDLAEAICANTCQDCASTRGVTTGGHRWTLTLCGECRERGRVKSG